ncbi:MAG: ATP-grasp domain-containing protein [Muribaculum sp.]|nr:ATP-grasp domain-containing protein [Muribaculum sp.]
MSKINVLVFPDGEINSIELHDALSTCVNIDLYGASSIERHGKYVFKNHISGVPKISDSNFYDKFNEIINKYNIDIVIPTHDTVVLEFIRNADKINAKVMGGNLETAEICRSKKKTYSLFKNCAFTPKTYTTDKNVEFPLFVKPDEGQGAKGTIIINSESELSSVDFDANVVCEYLPGEEMTVDCLTDKNGVLSVISPRSRQRVLGGVCTQGKTEQLTSEIENIANEINDRMSFRGLWYFQIKRDRHSKFKLLEVSCRCAGTMCLTRARGINLPLLSVYVTMGYDIEVTPNPYSVKMDRTLISRYEIDYDYKSVYFDLDDTLIVDNKVNLNAIRFIYQCKNNNTPIYLLTKHAKTVDDTLKIHSVDKGLFEKIIHIEDSDNKSKYIKDASPILIDNAFAERKEVYGSLHIPVFDVDAIEVLLDWRN